MTRTEQKIEALRAEAGEAGDLAQVAICDRALAGDVEAMEDCQEMIDAARARALADRDDDQRRVAV